MAAKVITADLEEKVNVLLKNAEVQREVTNRLLKISIAQQDQIRSLNKCIIFLSCAVIILAIAQVINTVL